MAKLRIRVALAAALLAAGCTFSIFPDRAGPPEHGAAPPADLVAGIAPAPDGSVLLPNVLTLSADRGRLGVILRADGLAPTQGFHSAELRPSAPRGADGIETLELRARPPQAPAPVGAQATRVLSVGRFYTNREMREIRGFRVVAGQNALSAAAPPPIPPAPAPPLAEF